MVEHLIDDGRRTRRNVGPHARRFDDVNGMAAAGDEDLGGEVVVVVDVDDLANQLHAVGRDIVKPADERADERGAGLGRKQRLRRRKHQRHVHPDAFTGHRLAGANAVARQRHLDDHVIVNGGEIVSLPYHPGKVGRGHFAAHGPLDDVADPLQILSEIARFLGEERRVRRHAVENAERGERFDVLDAAGIDKKFHGLTSSSLVSGSRDQSRLYSGHLES